MAQDAYKYFRVEARELIEQLGHGVLDLEKGASCAQVVPRLLRLAHTLKGAARVVKQREIADAAHAIEDALAPLRETASAVANGEVNQVLALIDTISTHVAALAPEAEVGAQPARTVADEALRTVRADVAEMDGLLAGLAAATVQLGALRRSLTSLDRARHTATLLSEQLGSPHAREATQTANGHGSVTKSLADELRGLVAGLERGLASGVEQIDRELRQVRDAAERLRLLPSAVLFGTLERTVRDAAQAVGKRVRFDGRGDDSRLDADVLGAMQGALVQVVRNAVAHGIESDSARRAAGKPAEGRITVEVVRRGKRVAFVCTDDGRGIDVDAIRVTAQRKGLVRADARRLEHDELSRLLLSGGISTSKAVTEVAGRGVGFDVVRAVAERLGGTVVIRSEAGQGTVVEVVVPVSLASLEALVVETSGLAAAIPLAAVRRTLRVRPDEVVHAPDGDGILFEGAAIPFIPLECPLTGAAAPAQCAVTRSAVVVQSGRASVAVGIDKVRGTGTVVVRPLPALAPADPLIAGASLDEEGNPQVVLDADGLVAWAQRCERSTTVSEAPRLPILVIDDSPTTRMLEQSILEAAGYAVETATSAEAALEQAQRQAYGLFLVDVEMPGMDGFAFVEHTRRDPRLCGVPAVMVTSRSSPEDRARGESAGARAYIVKSEFDQANFLDTIRTLAG